MNNASIQIVKEYEEFGKSLSEISSSWEISETEVIACLMQNSVKYRKENKSKNNKDFTGDHLALANACILQTMLTTEDENLKFRAAKYIRDDKKGRKDFANKFAKLNIDVFTFNQQMQKARRSIEESNKVKVIDVIDESKLVNA